MKLRLFRVRTYLRSSLWFLPALCVLTSFILAQSLLTVDRALLGDTGSIRFLFSGGPESARSVLSTIAASMITFTGVVFSITMLVLQLASAQFSPRVLRTFLRDINSQLSLGVFVATFTYALLVLRAVRSASDGEVGTAFVPSLSISTALLLVLVSIALFVRYIDHIAQSIRATTIIARVAKETRAAIDRMYPEGIGFEYDDPEAERPTGPPGEVIPWDGPSGIVQAIDGERITQAASKHDLVLGLVPMVGDFVPAGGPLFEVWGNSANLDRQVLRTAVSIASERTMEQDPAFGFRQLVDIAERALSPGTNDPTTAVQAIDQIHDLLRRISQRRFPARVRTDDTGQVRAILPRPGWDDYLTLALDEIRRYGSGSVQVMRRLRALLKDLHLVTLPERRIVLERQLALLDAEIERGFDDPRERRDAREPGFQGHGPSHAVQSDRIQRAADQDNEAQVAQHSP